MSPSKYATGASPSVSEKECQYASPWPCDIPASRRIQAAVAFSGRVKVTLTRWSPYSLRAGGDAARWKFAVPPRTQPGMIRSAYGLSAPVSGPGRKTETPAV
nr:hypothetical protein GCM10020092_095440 [Actinoplanes digitatis]